VNAGDTFFFSDHLWMVISEPTEDEENILVVNFNTWKPWGDPACVLNAGEHPFIRHRTYVNYRDALVMSRDELAMLLRLNQAAPRAPLSEPLLKKIRERAGEADIAIEHFNILVNQGLVEAP